MSTSPLRGLATLTLVATVLAACTGVGGSKAGGPAAAVVLTMATLNGEPGYNPAIDDLPRRVEAASNGNIRIETVFRVGDFKPDAEEAVVRGVQAGTYDLGVVGTRVFDTLGVNSFQALSAPMLIDSYEIEGAVLRSGIPAQMLGSLDQLHVSGLGILGDGLRKPIGVDKPMVTLADWRGIRFGTYRSDAQAAAIRALGAEPVVAFGPERDAALDAKQIQGFEMNLLGYEQVHLFSRAPYVAANVNLWPQMFAVIANPGRLAALSADQRDELTRAVRDTQAASVDLVKADVDLASLCREGARVTNASDGQVDALRKAFAQVYDELRRDSTTGQLIGQISDLASKESPAVAAAIPAGCSGSAPETTVKPTVTPSRTTTVTPLDGTWKTSYTLGELAATKHVDPSEVTPHNAGTFTIRFDRGVLSDPTRPADPSQPQMTYVVEGDTLTIYTPDASGEGQVPPPGPAIWKYRWSIYNDTLTFEKLGGQEPGCSGSMSMAMCEPTGFTVKPWHRIH
jgi:TRAP-type C4-dicarboxylate transport system substrate-binding protein